MKAPAGPTTQSRAGWRGTAQGGDDSRQVAGLRGGAHGLRAGKHGSALRVLGGLGGAAFRGAMQRTELLPRRPSRLPRLACRKLANRRWGHARLRGNLGLADA